MIPLIVALTLFLVWSPLTRFLEAGTLIGLDTYTTSSALAVTWYQLFWYYFGRKHHLESNLNIK
jgi:hypothetical protein